MGASQSYLNSWILKVRIVVGSEGIYVCKRVSTRILVNSIPKAGTHLLRKGVLQLPGTHDAGMHLDVSINNEQMQNLLKSVRGGGVVTAHLFYQEAYAQILAEERYRALLIIRDPRDLVVSFAFFVAKVREHYLHKFFADLPDDRTRIMAVITGVNQPLIIEGVNEMLPPELRSERVQMEGIALGDINTSFRIFLEWQHEPYNMIVKFEDMVGLSGGGSSAAAERTIRDIAEHIELQLSPDEIARIASESYDTKSPTFRRGMIGDWKEHFLPEHKVMFKAVAGELLIDLGYETGLDW